MRERSETKGIILVVDDTETMRRFHESFLVKEGYKVETAKDGQDALNKMAVHCPDLVLMDIDMPVMDGVTCCRTIKSDKSFADTKVIMVTSQSEFKNMREAFKAGCDDYVTKPVNQAELMGKIKELLKFSALKRLIKS
jgi:CheY-like chemotaxis protein